MMTNTLPSRDVMTRAFLARDSEYDGVFFVAVRTTGVFCRPTCPARKPRIENVEFLPSAREALLAGYRPCKRCRPMEPTGSPPTWLAHLLEQVDEDPARRWSDGDLRALGLVPDRVRRWFQTHHGMTFHAYSRARRLGVALGEIRDGTAVAPAAYGSGWESLSGFAEAFRRGVGVTPRNARGLGVVTVRRVPTPLGPMVAGATDSALCLLEFSDRRMLERQLQRIEKRMRCAIVPGNNPILDQATTELTAYFAGTLRDFSVPVHAAGTPFQESVWHALRRIPYGTTTSYAALARTIDRPSAVRAVARANGDNRLAIVIPCHRVVGANGSLTGYGGGLWRKRKLLDLESGVRGLLDDPPRRLP